MDSLQIDIDIREDEFVSKFNTASRLLNQVVQESGTNYGDAIYQCLVWPETDLFDFDDSAFVMRFLDCHSPAS